MLGRFLEISVRAQDVPQSLAFYESLGFAQAPVGDAWNHAYAVVTDGRLFLGLHAREFDAPALTWVRPDLAGHASRLQSVGIEFTHARLDDDALHEIRFADPSGQAVTLLEARTFSPPPRPLPASSLGYFEEFGIPTGDLPGSAAFWDALGLVTFDPVHVPFAKIVAAGRDVNLGLYAADLGQPVLVFSATDMEARIDTLRDRGYRLPDRLPRGMSRRNHAMLEAPEGTWLMLTTSAD